MQTLAEIGEDRTLHLRLPDDTPVGTDEVVVIVESHRRSTLAERRAAAQAARGALAGSGMSTEDFLVERREDERQREERFGR